MSIVVAIYVVCSVAVCSRGFLPIGHTSILLAGMAKCMLVWLLEAQKMPYEAIPVPPHGDVEEQHSTPRIQPTQKRKHSSFLYPSSCSFSHQISCTNPLVRLLLHSHWRRANYAKTPPLARTSLPERTTLSDLLVPICCFLLQRQLKVVVQWCKQDLLQSLAALRNSVDKSHEQNQRPSPAPTWKKSGLIQATWTKLSLPLHSNRPRSHSSRAPSTRYQRDVVRCCLQIHKPHVGWSDKLPYSLSDPKG